MARRIRDLRLLRPLRRASRRLKGDAGAPQAASALPLPQAPAPGTLRLAPADPTPPQPADPGKQPEVFDLRTDRPLRRPTLEQIGRVGTGVLGPHPAWLRRHVETVTLRSLTSARRQLTIDVVLPEHEGCSFPWRAGERLFYLPIALMLKHPPASNLDMRDEHDTSLPVLNRLENAKVTLTAVSALIADMFDEQLAEQVSPFLHEAVFALDADTAKTHAIFAITRITALRPDARELPDWDWLVGFLVLLSAHSLSWLGLAGLPGERRVVKFAYDIEVETPKPIRRRPRWVSRSVRAEGRDGSFVAHYQDWDPGDGYPHGFLTRMLKRFVTIIGGAAYHVPIQTPYIRNTPSYHLQVNAPEGLETRRIELLAELCDSTGERKLAVDASTPDCAHLYFSEARVRRMGMAIVSLRVGRRGLLSYSLAASIVIASMLWLFATHHATIQRPGDNSASVAVLLLVPTLMLVFAIRPGEHLLATKLLSGARAMLALLALLCVVAAGELVGARPFHRGLGTLWRWDAELASLLALVIAVCWLLSFAMVEALRSALRRVFANDLVFAGAVIVLLAVQYAWLAQTNQSPMLSSVGDYIDWIVLGLIAAVGAWIALFHTACSHRENSRLIGFVVVLEATVCLAGAASRARVGGSMVAWHQLRAAMLIVAPAAAGVILLLVVAHLYGRPRPEPTINDEHLFFFGPSGVAPAPPPSEGASSSAQTSDAAQPAHAEDSAVGEAERAPAPGEPSARSVGPTGESERPVGPDDASVAEGEGSAAGTVGPVAGAVGVAPEGDRGAEADSHPPESVPADPPQPGQAPGQAGGSGAGPSCTSAESIKPAGSRAATDSVAQPVERDVHEPPGAPEESDRSTGGEDAAPPTST